MNRLLSVNNIVPFIHLPARKRPKPTDLIVEVSSGGDALPTANKLRQEEPIDENIEFSTHRDPAIVALLALGCM